ncbi:MAG TPA: peptidoglycan DD-metalloendopeptidase family protein [Pseudomonadales bacterium]|nr:peptidoglycan DD-metalloendopeptidase family protein [Pseudomonadales bacterium]
MGARTGALRRTCTGLAAILLVMLTAAAPPAARAADAEDPRARLERIDADLERLENWLAASRVDRDELADELRSGDLDVARLAAAAREAEAALQAQRARIVVIGDDIRTLEALEAEQREALLAQLRSAWVLSRRDPLQIVLEAEAPDRLGRMLHFHRSLTEARLGAIDAWEASRAELAVRREDLGREEAVLVEQRDRLAARAAELTKVRRERGRLLATLEARIGEREDARTDLLRDRQRLVELLERLSREAQQPTGTSFAAARGKLPWPVSPRIAQAFGTPLGPGKLPADGVMLSAEPGTPIQAIAPGRIVFADWMRGFGLMVIVDHGGGFMSLYAQAESLLRVDGDVVEAGEPLATAGQSGGSARPGVWFEIRRAGAPEDPVSWCIARGRG